MRNRSRVKIKYQSDISERFGIFYPQYDFVSVSVNSVQRYGGSLVKMIGWNATEMILMNFLTEVMDERNIIHYCYRLRMDFISYMGSEGNTVFSEDYVNKTFRKLTKSEFLLRAAKRGVYYVNPLYFCKQGTDREGLIKYLLEEKLLTTT